MARASMGATVPVPKTSAGLVALWNGFELAARGLMSAAIRVRDSNLLGEQGPLTKRSRAPFCERFWGVALDHRINDGVMCLRHVIVRDPSFSGIE